MSDEFQFWRDALAGPKGEIHADHPQPGYYKMRNGKDAPWQPVAIWSKNGALVARVGSEVRDPHKIWTYCAGNPIAKDVAKHAFEHGTFPGDVAIGHNSGATLTERITRAKDDALAWLKGIADKITDDTAKDATSNHRTELLKLIKEAEGARDAKLRPHLDAASAIRAEYNPLINSADETAKSLRSVLSIYMAAEDDKKKAAAEKAAREENERRLADYERQRKAAEQSRLNEPVKLPTMVAPEPVKVTAGGQRGKKTGLREIPRFAISDYAAALAHAKDHPDVIAAVEKVCFVQARAGADVPGVTKTIEKVAV